MTNTTWCQRDKIRIVNALWQTQLWITTPSQEYFSWLLHMIGKSDKLVCKISSETRIFTARPRMLQWKWYCQHVHQRFTVLFFPNRTLQFIGPLTDNDVYHLYQHCRFIFNHTLPFPRLKTMTIVYPLCTNKTDLSTIFKKSDANCVYESEQFPGAQLTYWSPLHVILFHTGNVTISSVKALYQVDSIIHDLNTNRYFPLFKENRKDMM